MSSDLSSLLPPHIVLFHGRNVASRMLERVLTHRAAEIVRCITYVNCDRWWNLFFALTTTVIFRWIQIEYIVWDILHAPELITNCHADILRNSHVKQFC